MVLNAVWKIKAFQYFLALLKLTFEKLSLYGHVRSHEEDKHHKWSDTNVMPLSGFMGSLAHLFSATIYATIYTHVCLKNICLALPKCQTPPMSHSCKYV